LRSPHGRSRAKQRFAGPPIDRCRRAALPRNPNGKIDRKELAGEFADAFQEEAARTAP
jgi:hypothetical protein